MEKQQRHRTAGQLPTRRRSLERRRLLQQGINLAAREILRGQKVPNGHFSFLLVFNIRNPENKKPGVCRVPFCIHELCAEKPTRRKSRVQVGVTAAVQLQDRKSTRLNSSHVAISYAVFCLKKKTGI